MARAVRAVRSRDDPLALRQMVVPLGAAASTTMAYSEAAERRNLYSPTASALRIRRFFERYHGQLIGEYNMPAFDVFDVAVK
jgi:hypothetical protein